MLSDPQRRALWKELEGAFNDVQREALVRTMDLLDTFSGDHGTVTEETEAESGN